MSHWRVDTPGTPDNQRAFDTEAEAVAVEAAIRREKCNALVVTWWCGGIETEEIA